MAKTDFAQEMDRTRTDVGQITCWCITIALNQEFGVGRSRIDRIADVMTVLEDENAMVMKMDGTDKADEIRRAWFDKICDPDFRVPLLRAPRGRKEQQYRMAGDDAASVSWQLYAKAVMMVLGYKGQRLERLKKLSRDNYAQFNQWAHDDGLDVALERLKRCAEAAMRDELEIVENAEQSDAQTREVDRELRREVARKVALEATCRAARNNRPAQAAPLVIDTKTIAENIKRQLDTARQSSVKYRF